jgi:general secretion pathway protein B
MSYILDALTRSQQQRRQGDVPTLATPQWMLDPARAARARYLKGALAVLAGAAVLFAVHSLTRQDEEFSVAPQTAADAPPGVEATAPAEARSGEPGLSPTTPESVAPVAPPPSEPQVADNPGAPSQAPVKGQVARASDSPTPAPSPPPGPRPGDIALIDAPIASPPQRAATGKPIQANAGAQAAAPPPVSGGETAAEPIEADPFSALREAAEAATPVAPSTPDSETAAAPASSPTLARAEPAPAAAPDIDYGDVLPSVYALPSDVGASLGRLSINAHVYSDVPAGRMVIINMNRYREGDKLREGPRVEAITASGAILSYESYRFHLNLR